MALPQSFFGRTLIDFSSEKSAWRVPINTITAGNQVATLTLIQALEVALNNVALGVVTRDTTILEEDTTPQTPPTNPLAQRENKWLVRYHDAVTNAKFTSEYPCADLSLLSTSPQSDFMDRGNAAFTALKSAWEAVVRSPDDNNATVLDSLQFVGRRL